MRDGIDVNDSRVAWVEMQAITCMSEGMGAREAVRLAWDLALRPRGQPHR
jgi:hypothetical protein